ncbi:helix-turn-helix domain-containing protein [Pseudomonadota bacterium]
MVSSGQQVRERIVGAANRLFYERGFNRTAFSDIADAADIPRGNFYY